MSMLGERLQDEYPQVTRNFENIVEKTVKEQLKGISEGSRKRGRRESHRMLRMAAAAAACVCLIGGTAGAMEGYSRIRDWLNSLGPNKEVAEQLIETNVKTVYEEDCPLLEIESAYIDGSRLVYTAKLREGEENHPRAAKDHVIVNGIECLNEYFEEIPSGSGQYEGCITFSNEFMANHGNPEMLDITIQLYMSQPGMSDEEMLNALEENPELEESLSAENQETEEFTFSVPAGGLENTRMVSRQSVETNWGRVDVIEASVAPSAIKIQLQYEFSSDVAEEMWEIFRHDSYKLVDSSGVMQDIDECAVSSGFSDPVKDEEKWTMQWETELEGFDCTSDTITFIPCTWEENEDGKHVPDSQVMHEEKAFTINLITE